MRTGYTISLTVFQDFYEKHLLLRVLVVVSFQFLGLFRVSVCWGCSSGGGGASARKEKKKRVFSFFPFNLPYFFYTASCCIFYFSFFCKCCCSITKILYCSTKIYYIKRVNQPMVKIVMLVELPGCVVCHMMIIHDDNFMTLFCCPFSLEITWLAERRLG